MHTCSSTDAGRTGEKLHRKRRMRAVCPNMRACRSRSLLVQARVWELQQPSSSLSMAPKWWSQTSIETSLNRYCITQLYIRPFGPQCNMRHCLQVASEIREAGGEAMSVPGDVTAEGFASKIVKATIDKYGALHILVNNAGQQSLVCLCKVN